jgi:hypothetical protein
MILRLLIAAMMLMAITQFYLQDNKTGEAQPLKPKQQIEHVQTQLDDISEQAEEKRKKAMEEIGI